MLLFCLCCSFAPFSGSWSVAEFGKSNRLQKVLPLCQSIFKSKDLNNISKYGSSVGRAEDNRFKESDMNTLVDIY